MKQIKVSREKWNEMRAQFGMAVLGGWSALPDNGVMDDRIARANWGEVDMFLAAGGYVVADEQVDGSAERAKAIGLLSTLHPKMPIDTSDPVGMAKQIEAHVTDELSRFRAIAQRLVMWWETAGGPSAMGEIVDAARVALAGKAVE